MPAGKRIDEERQPSRFRMASCTCPSPFRERFDMRFPQVSERVKEAPAHALRAVFASIGQVLLVTDRMRNKPAKGEKAAGPRADERAEELAATATPPAAPRTTTAAETTTTEGPTPTTAASTGAGTAPAAPAAEPTPAAPAAATAAEAKAPASAAPKTAAKTGKRAAKAPAAESPAANRDTQTGNVRLLPDAGSAPAGDALAAPAAETPAAPAAEAPAKPAAEPVAAEPVAAEPVAAEPVAAEPVAAKAAEAAPAATEPAAAETAPPIANYGQLTYRLAARPAAGSHDHPGPRAHRVRAGARRPSGRHLDVRAPRDEAGNPGRLSRPVPWPCRRRPNRRSPSGRCCSSSAAGFPAWAASGWTVRSPNAPAVAGRYS